MKKLLTILLLVSLSVPVMALENSSWTPCLHYLFQEAPAKSWRLQNDGHGPYIKKWHLVAPQPTIAEMEAVEAVAVPWWKDQIEVEKANFDDWTNREKAIMKWSFANINILRKKANLSEWTKAEVKAQLKSLMEAMQ